MSRFTHLHTHSHYSLLNALPKVDELVKAAKKMGMTSLALTDNCNLYGTIEFYKECEKAELKPIIGIDAYVSYRSRHDKQSKERYRLVLLAENDAGYRNMVKLVTAAHLEGFYYKPRLDREIMELHHEGIIAIAPSFSSDIMQSLKLANTEQALERLEWYKKTFGPDNFFLEITHHPEIKGHQENMNKLVAFARETGTQLCAAHDVYYMHKEDRPARETLMAVQQNADISDKLEASDEDFSFISPETAEKYFKDLPDALENTAKIADRCNVKITLGSWVFPDYKVTSGLSHDDELRRVTYEGIESHGLERTQELLDRVEYELKVIMDKGYSPYFLVVGDLLRHAKKHGILTTTRGSAGGSMVSYLNYITTIDPIQFELPFERFLNPERPSAPDVDMDIADSRRDDMIEYAKSKYGVEKVAQIGTFGTMAARGSVRDVTRALGFPYALGDSLSKMIPMGAQGFPMTIDRALKEVPELKERYKAEPDVKTIIDMAKKIEGCARHMGIHAAGVVIAPTDITDFTPLQYDPKGDGKIITQYDMYSIEDAGLLKFDFLGIVNLSILADAIALVKKLRGQEIDIEKIPLDDKKTYEMLARGETQGLFQLNGDGMTRWLKELKPTVIHDISVMVALYRPGPMDNINNYIARKHGKEKITYLHPKMKDFLSKTFGVLVYQDDLLMTAIELAGYSWGEVDKFRKAVGKKIPEEMKKQHVKFVEGCQSHSGISVELAEKIWNLFEPFQGYGFNKAHAASYGRVAYQTAYMKANFPAEYMASVLTHQRGEVDDVAVMVSECKRMEIPVLPPDVNESFEDFTVVKGTHGDKSTDRPDAIRFGLTTIKNFGAGIAHAIIAERKAAGPFASLSDFLRRIKDKNMNKKSLESLVKAGALDSFGTEEPGIWRATLLHNLDHLLAFNKEERNKENEQDSLFGGLGAIAATELHLERAPAGNPADRLLWEKELLGLYISGHPLDSFREKLEKRDTTIKKLNDTAKEKQPVVVGGIVEEVKSIMTKKGDKMVFMRIADMTDSIETVVFPKTFEEFQDILVPENCIVVKGTFSTRNGEKSIVVDKVKVME
jgi:DNA polymerase III subunit alpha